MSPFWPALLLASSTPISLQPLQDGWFRLKLVYKPSSVQAHANAQLQLIAAARRLCKGRGRPVSEGKLTLDDVPSLDDRRGVRLLALSETWRCGAGVSPTP